MWAVVEILAAVVVGHAIGWTWYSPIGFSDIWCRYVFNIPVSEMKDSGPGPIYKTFVGYAIGATFYQYILNDVLMVRTVYEGVLAALMFSAVVAFTQIAHYAFQLRPMGLFFLDRAFDTIVLVSMAVVIALL